MAITTRIEILCIIFIASFIFCSSIQSDYDKIRGVKVSQRFSVMDRNGNLLEYGNCYVEIYYCRNTTLYNLTYTYDSAVNGKSLLNETRFHIFIQQKDSAYGYDYDEHRKPVKRRVLADSLLKCEWVTETNLYPIFQLRAVTLLSSYRNEDSGTLHETYVFKNADSSVFETSEFAFTNRLNGIGVSLCRELDSIKNMKLYKVNTVTNKTYMKEQNRTYPRHEIGYFMEEINIIRPEIRKYFELQY